MKRLVLAELHAGAPIWTKKSPRSLSIRFLAPQHLLQFFHFCRGFYLCLFATLPIIVPPSSTLQWAIEIKKKCLPWVTFPGKSLSFVIDARINGIYAYRLTGVIMIPHWIGCCEKAREFLIHESSVTTKCRVCSQFYEITKEERGTKIIQHLNSTYTWYKLFQEKSRAHKISVKFFSCKSWIYQYLNYNRKFLSMIYLFTVMKRWKSRKKTKQKNNNNSYRETQITPQFHWVEKKVISCYPMHL